MNQYRNPGSEELVNSIIERVKNEERRWLKIILWENITFKGCVEVDDIN